MRLILTFLTLTLLTFSTAYAKGPQNANVDAELRAFNDLFNEIVTARDADRFIELYAEDALWIGAGSPPKIGHDEPRGLINFLTQMDAKMAHSVDTLFVSDDGTQAVMVGGNVARIEKADQNITGTYLFVLKNTDNGWKIVTDMWHIHQPPAAPTKES